MLVKTHPCPSREGILLGAYLMLILDLELHYPITTLVHRSFSGGCITPKLHNSITPKLQNSITPQLHNSISLKLQNSISPPLTPVAEALAKDPPPVAKALAKDSHHNASPLGSQ